MIYLAYVAGPRGPEPQLWHKEKARDHFVGCTALEIVAGPALVPAELEGKPIDEIGYHMWNHLGMKEAFACAAKT